MVQGSGDFLHNLFKLLLVASIRSLRLKHWILRLLNHIKPCNSMKRTAIPLPSQGLFVGMKVILARLNSRKIIWNTSLKPTRVTEFVIDIGGGF